MSEQREQRDNDGVIFSNDRKESDRHPDFTGKACVGGVMYWVSSWIKQGRSGDFYTLAFKPMDEQQAPRDSGDQRRQQPRQQQQRGGYDRQPQRPQQQRQGRPAFDEPLDPRAEADEVF
jgi:hypothetical protein